MGKRILVVDDSNTIRQILRSMLEVHYFEILEAKDGREGLQKMESDNPDLVLLDIEMPDMNGLDMLKAFHSKNPTNPIPVIMVTAHSSPELLSLVTEYGALDYVVKPFTEKTIYLKVLKVLGQSEVRQNKEPDNSEKNDSDQFFPSF